MNVSQAVSEDDKDVFWAVVQDCLREFHRMKPDAVRRKAKKIRKETDQLTTSQMELFYHAEPFDVANDIAGDPLDANTYRDRYLHIRDEKHGNGISKQYLQERRKVKSKN
jgi:hypothetical protein